MPSIKQALPTEKIKHVVAFSERPRANAVRPYGKRTENFTFSVLFLHIIVCYTFQVNCRAAT